MQLEVEEAGPLRAVVLSRGAQRRWDGTGYVAFRGRVTAYAGKSYIEVEHQFIHGEEEEELTLEGLELRFVPGGAGEVSCHESESEAAAHEPHGGRRQALEALEGGEQAAVPPPEGALLLRHRERRNVRHPSLF